MSQKSILVTGAAGFIGFHVVLKLIEKGFKVFGLDSVNDYYQVGLKYDRLNELGIDQRVIGYNRITQSAKFENYKFIKLKLEDENNLIKLFAKENFSKVIHLAAQAGVRYSIENPSAYISSNITGFANLLEACRHFPVDHLVYASSSSIYGLNKEIPFSTSSITDYPISLYGATKKSNELMAHSYSHLFDIPVTGLRFFTVYGPWGRPDMAYFLFTEAILNKKSIKVFNNGELSRDMTYIEDIVDGIFLVLNKPSKSLDSSITNSKAKFKIYNLGNRKPIRLLDFISILEDKIGVKAKLEFLPMQAGDVETTYADVKGLWDDFGYRPETSLEEGLGEFIKWHKDYYGEKYNSYHSISN